VLDEPTNHLDMEARDVLTEALSGYEGTLLFVSHDRRFINALATRVVEVTPGEHEARVRTFLGNYDFYEAALAREAADRAPSAKPAQTASGRRPPRDKGQRSWRAERRSSRNRGGRGGAPMPDCLPEPSTARDGERAAELAPNAANSKHYRYASTEWNHQRPRELSDCAPSR
jgi:ATPase subunit of ABC transporter with duplicated ATPase domains